LRGKSREETLDEFPMLAQLEAGIVYRKVDEPSTVIAMPFQFMLDLRTLAEIGLPLVAKTYWKSSGLIKKEITFDKYGRMLEQTMFDPSGHLCMADYYANNFSVSYFITFYEKRIASIFRFDRKNDVKEEIDFKKFQYPDKFDLKTIRLNEKDSTVTISYRNKGAVIEKERKISLSNEIQTELIKAGDFDFSSEMIKVRDFPEELSSLKATDHWGIYEPPDFKDGLPVCPRNHTDEIIPIVYGYPMNMAEALAEEKEGQIKLAGCVNMSRKYYCKRHKLSF
jgi:hypothetical protein